MGTATDRREVETNDERSHGEREQDRRGPGRPGSADAPARRALPPHLQRFVARSRASGTTGGLAAPDLVALQRLAGNRAVTGLLDGRDRGEPPALAVQRAGGGRRRKSRRQHQAPRRQPQTTASGPSTAGATTTSRTTPSGTTAAPTESGWSLGGLASWIGGALGFGSESEGDGQLSGREDEETLGGTPEEDEQELLAMPKITIDLGEHELESTLVGSHGTAKGGASGKLKGGLDGVSGSGKLEAEVGFDNSLETGSLTYKVSGGELAGKGTVRGFVGVTGSAEGELSAGGQGVSAKGKMSAFAGFSTEGETEIVVKAGARQLASFKGALGVAVGGGGELSGHVRFSNGEFSFGSKGKLAAGLGFSWEYELRLEAAPIASGVWSSLSTLHGALTDFLTDEDGEPIPL